VIKKGQKCLAVSPYGHVVTVSVAWMLLPAKERAIFWQAYGQADGHTRARARGWTLSLALVFLTNSADNPLMAAIGKHTLRELLR
jgi:hypothetical protein